MMKKSWEWPETDATYQNHTIKIKRSEFTAHLCILKDSEHANEVRERITSTNCGIQTSPYVLRLYLSNNQYKETIDDMGEFGAGECILNCLKNYDKLLGNNNILLIVTSKIQGCFVVDSIQHLKYNVIRMCCLHVLNKYKKTIISHKSPNEGTPFENEREVNIPKNREQLQTHCIVMDPFDVGLRDHHVDKNKSHSKK
jgi:hypothetical protein